MRIVLLLALALSIAAFPRQASAQGSTGIDVTILRNTSVRSAPSTTSSVLVVARPSTFRVTELAYKTGFVRLPLSRIIGNTAKGFGYIAVTDLVLVTGKTDTVAKAVTDTIVVSRRDEVVMEVDPDVVLQPTFTPRDAPVPPDMVAIPIGGATMTMVLRSDMTWKIGRTNETIVIPKGFVTDFASIPQVLWSDLSPVGPYRLAAVVHDYLYWFQPCDRNEADNLLMIAMKEAKVPVAQRSLVYQGVKRFGNGSWTSNAKLRESGVPRVAPDNLARPLNDDTWEVFQKRLVDAHLQVATSRLPRQKYCDYGKGQDVP